VAIGKERLAFRIEVLEPVAIGADPESVVEVLDKTLDSAFSAGGEVRAQRLEVDEGLALDIETTEAGSWRK
jgi:hypothetical protein